MRLRAIPLCLGLLFLPHATAAQDGRPAADAERAFRPERGPAPWLAEAGIAWSLALGSARSDWINHAIRLRDGTCLAVGYVNRDDAGADQEWDVVVLELTLGGELVRAQRHGGPGLQAAWTVLEDRQGRLALAGFASGASARADDWDAYFLLLARDGTVLAEERYGGPAGDRATGLVPTEDGGYLLVGETRSQGAGERDVLLVRVDETGREEWRRTHGSPGMERAFAGIPRPGGGAVVVGTCGSEGDLDGLVLAVDARGDELWRRTLAGVRNVVPHAVAALADEGMLVTGYTDSHGAGSNDAFALILAADGSTLSYELLGGAGDDRIMSAAVEPDGSAWLIGTTQSFGGGGQDVLLARLGADGALEPRALALGTLRDEHGTSVLPLGDGALLLGGYADVEGAPTGVPELTLLRLDPLRAHWDERAVAVTCLE